MKIVTIVGARPQFIKASAIRRAIERLNKENNYKKTKEVIIHTGQHYDSNMSDLFFEELSIPKADYHLGISNFSHGIMTGKMLQEIEPILINEKPDWVLVYGDTNSTLAGALAAVKLHIPVAHVEAGLRSFNRKMPEEINRIVADNCSELLFTPTKAATKQLQKEGVPLKKIHEVGDVMYDVALYFRDKATQESKILDVLGLRKKEYALATIHRQENTNDSDKLKEIFKGFVAIANYCPIIVPLHPRTKQALQKCGIYTEIEKKVRFIDPLGYLDMIQLEAESKVILTDSGGVQKEAYFFGVPCLTLREETEWLELIEKGFNKLVTPKEQIIVDAFISCKPFNAASNSQNLYGLGDASEKIILQMKALS